MRRIFSVEVVAAAVVLVAVVVGYSSFGSSPPTRLHYPDGSLWREFHVDEQGRFHGRLLEFFADGTVSRDVEYSHGSWVESRLYYPNGQIAQESVIGRDGDVVRVWLEDGTEITPPLR